MCSLVHQISPSRGRDEEALLLHHLICWREGVCLRQRFVGGRRLQTRCKLDKMLPRREKPCSLNSILNVIVYSYLVHLELPLGQTAILHDIALASPSNANNTLGMKLVDSF